MKWMLLAVALCSCASNRRLVHDTKGAREYYRDVAKCKAQAGQAAGYGNDMGSALAYRQALEECMYGEGWYWLEN